MNKEEIIDSIDRLKTINFMHEMSDGDYSEAIERNREEIRRLEILLDECQRNSNKIYKQSSCTING